MIEIQIEYNIAEMTIADKIPIIILWNLEVSKYFQAKVIVRIGVAKIR